MDGLNELDIVQLRSIFDSMGEGVVVLDRKGDIAIINAYIENIFSVKQVEVVGHPIIEVIRNPELNLFVENAVNSQLKFETELEMVSPVEKVFKIKVSLFGAERDGKKYILMVLQDITELRRLESIRKEFAANVSHELRTPLSAIKGFVETLIDGGLDDKKNNMKFLRIINDNVSRLEYLINDVLDLSKIESGKAGLKIEKALLHDVLARVLKLVAPVAQKKKVEISVKLGPGAESIHADISQLEQVLINLLDNAIKFNNESGKIFVNSFISPKGLEIRVRDTGIGIPKEDLERIFERFYRVDKGRSRELGGTGLGLSIVKHLVENHGGSVRVKSELHKGTEFVLSFPLRTQKNA